MNDDAFGEHEGRTRSVSVDVKPLQHKATVNT